MRKNTKYNNVNVTTVNEDTHNHCVNVDQLINGKDFKFVVEGKEYIVSAYDVMRYISANPHCYRKKRHENDETGKVSYSGFYLIKDSYIVNCAK